MVTVTAEENSIKIPIEVVVSFPSVPKARLLTKEDVWGSWDENTHKRTSRGMIQAMTDEVCPVWGDVVPYKSVTVVCHGSLVFEVEYWLQFVRGGDSVSKYMELPDGYVAMRSDYMCW